MFKHHRFEVQVHTGGVSGARPAATPTSPAQPAAGTRPGQTPAESPEAVAAAAAFRQRACVVDGAGIDRATYVRQRMADENVTSPQARQSIEREFERYAGADQRLDPTELAQSMGDYALSRADQATLTAPGLTGRGPSVSANQTAVNEWLRSPAGRAYAQAHPDQVTVRDGRPTIAVDGKEGPQTRSALAAMGRDQRSSNAVTEVEAIASANPPAYADAQRLPALLNNIPEGHPSRARTQEAAITATKAAIEGIANGEGPAEQRATQIRKLAENLPAGEARTAAEARAAALTEPGTLERLGNGLLETAVPPYAIANQMQRYARGEQGLATTFFNSVLALVPGGSLVRNLVE